METKIGLGAANIINQRYQCSFMVEEVLDENLKFNGNETQNPSSDIIEVYDIPKYIHEYFSFMNLSSYSLHKQPKKLTVAEICDL